MFPFWNKRRAGVASLLLSLWLVPFASEAEIDPVVSRSWEQPTGVLVFQYRLFPQAEVEKIAVTQNGKALDFTQAPFANSPLNTSAILVLVDTSVGSTKAPRDRTLADNKQWIDALLAQAQSRDLIGVSSFANDLVEVVPLGASFAEIHRKIAPLKANGLGTRIYRRGMDAIETLAQTKASRRALVILSDGKDEDTGFTKDDLIQAAQKHHVVVFALGCPETEADVPALGNLEKIAAETHGLSAQAPVGTAGSKERAKTDAAFALAVLNAVDAGGEVSVPLNAAIADAPILFEITTKGGEKFSFTHPRNGTQPQANSVMVQPVTLKPAPKNPTQPEPWIQQNRVYLAEAGAIALLLAAGLWLRIRKKTPPPVEEIVESPEPLKPPEPPLAYLEMQDADSKRVPITQKASRIGRNPANDIVFANTSISGYHAELHAKRDGTFYISDLGSGNGVVVNGQRIAQSADLKEGDLIELGEVRFRFRLG
jgi:hypothetical protein